MDSTEASQQVIEQWITNQLLYQEALRRGLRNDPEVQRLLEENERSVLISALLERLYQEEEAGEEGQPGPAEVQAYYERYKEQLRLREPYVRVRYLHTTREEDARTVHRTLREATAVSDSLWEALVDRYADNPEEARLLASRYFPESRLFTAAVLTPLREALQRLRDGDVARSSRSTATTTCSSLSNAYRPAPSPSCAGSTTKWPSRPAFRPGNRSMPVWFNACATKRACVVNWNCTSSRNAPDPTPVRRKPQDSCVGY